MIRRMSFVLLAMGLLGGADVAAAQQRQVSGTITGNNNAPLSAATVSIAGTNRGVRTDSRGNFSIPVEGDARLRFAAPGYKARDLTVAASQNTLNVRLEEDVLNLEALVVTGQATVVARQNVANDVAVVSRRELERVPAQTLDRALQGKVAGATIRTNSGAPGGGAQIRIRGASSITGNASPLYVVDGVVISDVAIPGGQNAISRANSAAGVNSSVQDNTVNRIADLNPNDIENVEILKGASAAAIYGSRAAAGVIVITTKRGQAGAPRFSLSQRFGYAEIARKLGSRTFTSLTEARANFDIDSAMAVELFNPDGTPKATYDLEEEVFGRSAPQRETNLSVSGGSEATQYYISGLVLDDQGIAPNTGYEKQSMTVNLRQALGRRIRLNVNSSLLHSVAARGITGNDNAQASYVAAISATPSFYSLKPVDGVFRPNPFTDSNPLETATRSQNDEDVWRALGSLNMQADLFQRGAQSLRFVGTGGADYFNQNNRLYYPPTIQLQPFAATPGTAVSGGGQNLNLNANANLIHSLRPESGAFSATTSVGMQFENRDLRRGQVTGRNLLGTLDLPYFGASQQTSGRREQVRNFGGYIQEELLLFQDRLNVTAGLRADRSSNNSDTEKYFLYPKLNAAFNVPGSFAFASNLKLRGAFGRSGNEPLYSQKFTALNLNNIEGLPAVYTSGTIGSSDLHPEVITELEGGFDVTLFQERALLTFTGYRRQITDLLLARSLAPSSGFGTEFFNGGQLNSNGIEASLQATPVQRGVFRWISHTTFSRNRTKVVELPVEEFSAGNSFGNSFGSYRIRQGFSPTTVFANYGRDASGAFIVRPIGESEPDFQFGFNNEFRLGRFSMSSLFDWSKGGLVVNLTRNYYDGSHTTRDFLKPSNLAKDEFRPFPECGTTCLSGEERLHWFANFNNLPVYVEDGSFVKLREVSLTYDLPTRLLGGRVNTAQLSLSGRNLRMWTDYSGYDPEVSNFGNVTAGRNQDVTPFPPSRTFWLGLNLGF